METPPQQEDIAIVRFDHKHLMENGTAEEASALIQTIYDNHDVELGRFYKDLFLRHGGRDLNNDFLSQDEGNNYLYLAIETTHGKVVGVLGASMLYDTAKAENLLCGASNIAYLNWLAVAKDYRGQGIAPNLHDRFEEDSMVAAARVPESSTVSGYPMCKVVNLHPQNDFGKEHSRYRDLGYHVVGEIRVRGAPNGETLILMSSPIEVSGRLGDVDGEVDF